MAAGLSGVWRAGPVYCWWLLALVDRPRGVPVAADPPRILADLWRPLLTAVGARESRAVMLLSVSEIIRARGRMCGVRISEDLHRSTRWRM